MTLEEFSGMANMASTVHGTHNLSVLSAHPHDKPKKHKRKKKHESVCDKIVAALFSETVRKKGDVWKLYDDHTKVELGTYRKRRAAWNAQRIRRHQDKLRRQQMHRKKASRKVSMAKRPYHPHSKHSTYAMTKPPHHHHGKNASHAMENIVARALLEASPYVFEQTPTSQEAAGWDNFIARMSHEVLQSDPRLKGILVALHKTRLKVLQQAHDAISSVLQKTGQFEVGKGKLERQDQSDEPIIVFDIQIAAAKKTVPIGIMIQHGKPVFSIPEQTKALLNALATKESKLLRAELLHVQETVFDNMHDVHVAEDKRNKYLAALETKLDKMLSSMVPVQIALLRNLIKTKYKGMQ